MSNLINKELLLENLIKCKGLGIKSCEKIAAVLDDLPTVDAVPIVRCKECIHFNERNHTCTSLYLAGQTIVTGYCFNGMRKKV